MLSYLRSTFLTLQDLGDALLRGLKDGLEDVQISTILTCIAMDVATAPEHLRCLGGPAHYTSALTALLQRILPRCQFSDVKSGDHALGNITCLDAVTRALALMSFSSDGKAAIVESSSVQPLLKVLRVELEVRHIQLSAQHTLMDGIRRTCLWHRDDSRPRIILCLCTCVVHP
jgi:hypothetical protein